LDPVWTQELQILTSYEESDLAELSEKLIPLVLDKDSAKEDKQNVKNKENCHVHLQKES